MEPKLFHIFRNTPLGRETLLQSLFFCNTVGSSLIIYIPKHTKFLMYFENDVVQVDLDGSYLTAPETALAHASALAEEAGDIPVRPAVYDELLVGHLGARLRQVCPDVVGTRVEAPDEPEVAGMVVPADLDDVLFQPVGVNCLVRALIAAERRLQDRT